jgi:hypothetical protein
MTKNDYEQVSNWMSDKGFFATSLPTDCYNCDISSCGITYTEGTMTISIGDWPCGFAIRISFNKTPCSFSVSRVADYPIDSAWYAIEFIRENIEDLFDEYEMNMRVRFHNAF